MASLGVYLLVSAAATAVIWKGSEYLEKTSEQLAAYYGLPAIVQGAVVTAIGSSFPELSSTVLATLLHGEFSLGVAAIVGSAIFNILVIPGIAAVRGDALEANRALVYKEAQFYMLAVAVLLLTFSFAVIYAPVAGASLVGNVTRPLALIPVLVYGLYLFTQWQDTRDAETGEQPDINPWKQWGILAASLVVIVIGVEGLVRSAIGLGEIFNTPSFLWGLTIIAAGTSLPDAFVSIRAAEAGEGVTSMANVLGSNIFDLLIAIPAGVLLAGATAISFADAAPMMGVLTLATIILFATLRTELVLSKREGYGLIVVYSVFILWMVLETVNVVNLVAVA